MLASLRGVSVGKVFAREVSSTDGAFADKSSNGDSVRYEKGRPSLDDAYQVVRLTELLLDVQSARLKLATQREQMEAQLEAMRTYLAVLLTLTERVRATEMEKQVRLHIACTESAAEYVKVLELRHESLATEEQKLSGAEGKLVGLLMELDPVAAAVVASPAVEPSHEMAPPG